MLDGQPAARLSARLNARKTFSFEFGADDDDEHEAGLFNDVMSRLYSSTERNLAKKMIDCFLDKARGVAPAVPLSKNVAQWGEKIAKEVRRMSVQNKPFTEEDIYVTVDAISDPKPAARPTNPREWTTDHVVDWMVNELHLPEETVAVARREEINGPVLLSLTEDDLRDLGVSPFGRRRSLKLAIDALVEPRNDSESTKFVDIANMETVSISSVPKSVKSSTVEDRKASIVQVPEPADGESQRSNAFRVPNGNQSAQAPLQRTSSTCRSFSPQRQQLDDIHRSFPRLNPPPPLTVSASLKPSMGPRQSPNPGFIPAARAMGPTPATAAPPNEAESVGARQSVSAADQGGPQSSRISFLPGQSSHVSNMRPSSPVHSNATSLRGKGARHAAFADAHACRSNREPWSAAQHQASVPAASAWTIGRHAEEKATSPQGPMVFRSASGVVGVRRNSDCTMRTSSSRGSLHHVPVTSRAGVPKVPLIGTSTPTAPTLESFSKHLHAGLHVRPVTPLRAPKIDVRFNPPTQQSSKKP